MGKYFGTDGFRGEANKVLTADHAYKIGRYLGWYYNQNHRGRIIIGKDTRRSSYMFEYVGVPLVQRRRQLLLRPCVDGSGPYDVGIRHVLLQPRCLGNTYCKQK